MAYKKQNFYTNQMLKAEHLNNIEDGIIANEAAIAEKQPKGDYLTEHQKIKTINGQSLIGEGNIKIQATRSRVCSLKDGEYDVLAINHRGYSKEAPEKHNNSAIVGYRFTFKRNDGTKMKAGDITSVTISRKIAG